MLSNSWQRTVSIGVTGSGGGCGARRGGSRVGCHGVRGLNRADVEQASCLSSGRKPISWFFSAQKTRCFLLRLSSADGTVGPQADLLGVRNPVPRVCPWAPRLWCRSRLPISIGRSDCRRRERACGAARCVTVRGAADTPTQRNVRWALLTTFGRPNGRHSIFQVQSQRVNWRSETIEHRCSSRSDYRNPAMARDHLVGPLATAC